MLRSGLGSRKGSSGPSAGRLGLGTPGVVGAGAAWPRRSASGARCRAARSQVAGRAASDWLPGCLRKREQEGRERIGEGEWRRRLGKEEEGRAARGKWAPSGP
jgi:hypothetical protein